MSCLPKLSRICLVHPERWSSLNDEIRRTDLILSTTPEEVKDKCKTVCETVIKTALISANIKTEEESENLDMQALKTLICSALELSQSEAKLIKSELTYLAEIRNHSGLSGHGRSLQRQQEIRDSVSERENERLLEIADSVLADIIVRFEIAFPLNNNFLKRSDNYDQWLDVAYGKIPILDTEYVASDILYGLDEVAYKDGLRQFEDSTNQEDRAS